MKKGNPMVHRLIPGAVLLLGMMFAIACTDDETNTTQTSITPAGTSASVTTVSGAIQGTVKDGKGTAVVGATVYMIPADAIDMTKITPAAVLDGSARSHDEPLEDAVRYKGHLFNQAVTDAEGKYLFSGKFKKADYYFYVAPATTDTTLLPGGDKCRKALSSDFVVGKRMNITLSGKPSDSASYVGSSKCLGCHADYAGQKMTAHRLGLSVPEKSGGLQNKGNFPNFNAGTNKFLKATTYAGGTVLSVGDYDSTKGFDKYEILENAAGAGFSITNEVAKFYLWKDSSDKHYITIENTGVTTDPNSPLTLNVDLTYGGTLYKQRYLVRLTSSPTGTLTTGNGRYPLLQFQGYPGISEGKESNYAPSRSVWRDYHFDYFRDATTGLLKAPDVSKNFELKCATCHFTGYVLNTTMNSHGEWLADAVDDENGAFDIDGDGYKDEINVGCESCHGPGSEHITAFKATAIVNPGHISPSRENMICGTCHNRAAGVGSSISSSHQGGDMLFDKNNMLPKPGVSREIVLTSYVSRSGPSASSTWDDGIHSSSHHQQYPDLMASKHYTNSRKLVTCYDCHDVHATRSREGKDEFKHNLKGDPQDPTSNLCMSCHTTDHINHMIAKTGDDHAGGNTRCADCHMPKTAKTGAGMFGQMVGATPPASDSDVYWMNDISSHVFDVPSKHTVGVAGTTPGSAMPVPYTDRCGTCHNATQIKYLQPESH